MKSFLIVSALLLFSICIYAQDVDEALPHYTIRTDTDGWIGGGWVPEEFAPPVDIDEALPHYITPKSICVRYTKTITGIDKNGLQSKLIIQSPGIKFEYDLDPGDDIFQIISNTRTALTALGIESWIGVDKDKGYWLIFNVVSSKATESDTGLMQEKFDVKEMKLFSGAVVQLNKYHIIIL